jgi:hypothetical protein
MKFSWIWALATFFFVVGQGIVAWNEGTLSLDQDRRNLKLSFWMHWANYGDAVCLAIFSGLFMPYFSPMAVKYTWGIPIAVLITIGFYYSWWKGGVRSFILISGDKSKGSWAFAYEDVTMAGLLHFVFTIVQILLVWSYIVTKVPQHLVWGALFTFTIYIPLAIVEPGLAECDWPPEKKDVAIACGSGITFLALLLVVTWWKLFVQ